jgi:hypothetical protein
MPRDSSKAARGSRATAMTYNATHAIVIVGTSSKPRPKKRCSIGPKPHSPGRIAPQ